MSLHPRAGERLECGGGVLLRVNDERSAVLSFQEGETASHIHPRNMKKRQGDLHVFEGKININLKSYFRVK